MLCKITNWKKNMEENVANFIAGTGFVDGFSLISHLQLWDWAD